jgi:chemotaxis regulatin CheY-phosphate phosphatase CheZ
MFYIYLEESTTKAASKALAAVASPGGSAETSRTVRREVGAKWDKLSEQDLSALKDRDDLVQKIVSRYGIETSEAQRDVDLVLKGRHI